MSICFKKNLICVTLIFVHVLYQSTNIMYHVCHILYMRGNLRNLFFTRKKRWKKKKKWRQNYLLSKKKSTATFHFLHFSGGNFFKDCIFKPQVLLEIELFLLKICIICDAILLLDPVYCCLYHVCLKAGTPAKNHNLSNIGCISIGNL